MMMKMIIQIMNDDEHYEKMMMRNMMNMMMNMMMKTIMAMMMKMMIIRMMNDDENAHTNYA